NNNVEHISEVEKLGHRWRLTDPGLLVKRYPVCSAAHSTIDEISRLTYQADITPNDIDTIRLEVPKLVRISLIYDTPQTMNESQFSLPFASACAVRHGAVRLSDLNKEFLHSSEQQTLMKKIEICIADDLSTEDMRKRFPECAQVEILLKDGTKLSGFCGEAYGMPNRPLSDADFCSKIEDCLVFAGCQEVPDILDKDVLPLAADLLGRNTTKSTTHSLSKGGAYS
ncbi:MAG: MmgE/PrpD family protein, partial [Sneathiella sp.]|nr:MmgE/PrpD family protein [Sneathiella sp.]